jgi:hypothetical protein
MVGRPPDRSSITSWYRVDAPARIFQLARRERIERTSIHVVDQIGHASSIRFSIAIMDGGLPIEVTNRQELDLATDQHSDDFP